MLTKERILQQAAKVVLVNGYANTRLEDVAAEIGVTRPNLYYHFKNKEDLLLHLIDYMEREYSLHYFKPLDEETDPIRAIVGFFNLLIENMQENDYRGGCIMGTLAQELSNNHEPLRQRIAVFFDGLRSRLNRQLLSGMQSGYFRPNMVPDKTGRWIVATLQGCLLMSKTERKSEYLMACRDSVADYLGMMKS